MQLNYLSGKRNWRRKMLEIIKTNDGYMVQHMDGELEGQYLWDSGGNNLFDTWAEAERVFYGLDRPIRFTIPDWDWGETSNKKLREIFSITEQNEMYKHEQLNDFIEYLLHQIDVDEMVSKFLYYAPTEDIKSCAKEYGFLSEEKQE